MDEGRHNAVKAQDGGVYSYCRCDNCPCPLRFCPEGTSSVSL